MTRIMVVIWSADGKPSEVYYGNGKNRMDIETFLAEMHRAVPDLNKLPLTEYLQGIGMQRQQDYRIESMWEINEFYHILFDANGQCELIETLMRVYEA